MHSVPLSEVARYNSYLEINMQNLRHNAAEILSELPAGAVAIQSLHHKGDQHCNSKAKAENFHTQPAIEQEPKPEQQQIHLQRHLSFLFLTRDSIAHLFRLCTNFFIIFFAFFLRRGKNIDFLGKTG